MKAGPFFRMAKAGDGLRANGLHVLMCMVVGPLPLSFAETLPYADNFQTTAIGGSPTGWAPTAGTWAIGEATPGGPHFYQATSPAASGAFASMLQFANATGNFSITSTFLIDDPLLTVANERIGLAALATTGSLPTANYYLADIQGSNGNMRILSLGPASNPDFTTPGQLQLHLGTNIPVGSNYTMTLTGSYSGSTLNLSFQVTDGTNTQTVTASDPTPFAGQFFGLRLNNATGASDTLGVRFTEYTAIPEPGSLALMLLGGPVFLLLNRRKLRACF